MLCVCILSRYILVNHVGPWITKNGYISSIIYTLCLLSNILKDFLRGKQPGEKQFSPIQALFFSILANPKLEAVFQKILWCFCSRMMTAWVSLSREYWHTRTLGTKLVMSYEDWLHQVDILDFQMGGVCSECLLWN